MWKTVRFEGDAKEPTIGMSVRRTRGKDYLMEEKGIVVGYRYQLNHFEFTRATGWVHYCDIEWTSPWGGKYITRELGPDHTGWAQDHLDNLNRLAKNII